jgi:hypothetical protein
MIFFRERCRLLALPLALVMLFVSMPLSTVKAGLVTTEQVIQDNGSPGDREKVARFLQQEAVREQMAALGVDPSEVDARVAALSDQEISQLAGQIDELPAGQGGNIGLLVGVLLIIFIVLLITDLVGLTNVFSFVKRNQTH